MAWKGVHLSRPAHLSLQNHNLLICFRSTEAPQEKVEVPLEDLDYLVIDTTEASITTPLLAALAQASVLVLGVDRRHIPAWAAFPWAAYYRQGESLTCQLGASLPLKKQLWSRIIERKIAHQAQCLFQEDHPTAAALLEKMSKRVLSGDSSNMEAQAARVYWPALFPHYTFQRHANDLPNALLDYGYALIRSAIARNLCALGFVPQLGIHHCGQANAFNLADDLIEPFRPFVDLLAVRIAAGFSPDVPLNREHRCQMVKILSWQVPFDSENISLPLAIERTVNTFRRALVEKNAACLRFPAFPARVNL
jgi:CRISPR-associated endonuclease Cas1